MFWRGMVLERVLQMIYTMVEEETRRLINISIVKTQEVEVAHLILIDKRNFANFQKFKAAVDASAEAIRELMIFYRAHSITTSPETINEMESL